MLITLMGTSVVLGAGCSKKAVIPPEGVAGGMAGGAGREQAATTKTLSPQKAPLMTHIKRSLHTDRTPMSTKDCMAAALKIFTRFTSILINPECVRI